jgi:hypothetical protein
MTVNGDKKWTVLDYEASSLYSVIEDGQYRSTTAGRPAWKSLIARARLYNDTAIKKVSALHMVALHINIKYVLDITRIIKTSAQSQIHVLDLVFLTLLVMK